MVLRPLRFSILVILMLGGGVLALALPAAAQVQAQQPTGSVPTVTGTPRGPYITVNLDVDFVNVRSGPSEYFYPKIGILLRGQTAPALGRSPDGAWIQVYYVGVPGNTGWIYAPNVSLNSTGFLPFVEPPPTPTPPATPTINPTLEAAFVQPQTPTRLPTFTPPAPVENLIFADNSEAASRVPLGLIVLVLGVVGILIAVISFLRGR
ncbi:MAG: SH3 domain-containing protein [Anaerolineaceae bacterium]|nr:MAG: SH3 domain-containing protein [Anaerolineaceae bacterium]